MKKKQLIKNTIRNIEPENNKSEVNKKGQMILIKILGLIFIIITGILIYSNTFNCKFNFDDLNHITHNKVIRDLSDIKSIWSYSHTRFIAYITFAINYHYDQLNVWSYHLFNLIIHLINSILVWWLSLLIFSTPALKNHKIVAYKYFISITVALLFVSHPLATQSVTYVIQRMASLAALFYLLSVALYIQARSNDKSRILFFALLSASIISGILAMLTKENTFTLPFAILSVELFFFRNNIFSVNLKDYRTYLVAAGFASFMIFVISNFSSKILKPILPTQGITYTLTPFKYLVTQFGVIIKYLQMLFLPVNQMLDHDFPVSNGFFELNTLLSFCLILILISLAVFLFNKHRMISFGIFWFFLTLSIESSFIPIRDVFEEHRTYLPSFGIFLVISSTIYILLIEKYKIIIIFLILLIAGSNSYLTYQRNKVWKDEISLWSDNVMKAPNLARPHSNLGSAFYDLGQFDKSLIHFSKAISIDTNYIDAYCNRGLVYGNLREWDKAMADYSKVISINPNHPKVYFNRGLAHKALHHLDEAIEDYNKAIKMESPNADTYCNRGNAYVEIKEWNKAIDDYKMAISIEPNHLKAYSNRGIAYENLKQWDEAIADFTKAISINPNYFNAYYNRGLSFENLKEWERAIEDYSSSLKLDPKNKEAYFRRGLAYGNLGKWTNSINDFDRVINIDPSYEPAHKEREKANKKINKQ